jgi:hypothetical protein
MVEGVGWKLLMPQLIFTGVSVVCAMSKKTYRPCFFAEGIVDMV